MRATARRIVSGQTPVAADVVDAIHMDLKRIFPLSIVLEGEYGIKDSALSLPCVVGKEGVEKVLCPILTQEQEMELKKTALDIQESCAEINL